MTEPVLSVRDLTVRHGGLTALDEVTLDVAPAAITGLIGPNGAGKTTFLDAITGFTKPHAGSVTFAGASMDGLPAHRRSRLGLARTFQSLELFDDLTVRENVLVAARTPSIRSTITDVFWPKHEADPSVDETLELVGLADVGSRLPTELPNGPRHLVALARALVTGPQLVVLDEPAAGLNTAETTVLGETLRRLPDRGTAVLLVDHDMALVFGTCEIVHVLELGRLIASGPPSVVRAEPAVRTAYLGRQADAS